MFKKLRQNSKGDTIVEVLISLAILTMVLGGAYYTASQSFRNDRDAKEHSEALTIAQTQVESLRVLGGIKSGALCIDGSRPTNSCYVDSNNTSIFNSKCPTSVPYCYKVNIYHSPSVIVSGVHLTTYKVSVDWAPLGGGSTLDNVTLYYRVE